MPSSESEREQAAGDGGAADRRRWSCRWSCPCRLPLTPVTDAAADRPCWRC